MRKFYKLVFQVSNNKLWKEIVNEFGLPPTCTSASFTLRNHYSRFLYGFEQKYRLSKLFFPFFNLYYFGKDNDSDLPELVAGRIRKNPRKDRIDNSEEDDQDYSSESSDDRGRSAHLQQVHNTFYSRDLRIPEPLNSRTS